MNIAPAPQALERSGVGKVVMDLRPGDFVVFGDTGVRVEIISKSGRTARLCITSPLGVRIDRSNGANARPKHAMMATI